MRRAALLATALWAAALPAIAAYQVRFVPVRVAPFYEAGVQRADRPRVATHSGFDRQLASSRPEDITRVRDAIRAAPDSATPITMMVLAIRSYDVGLRDESVFWFYVARDRMATLSPREHDVALAVGRGHANAEIAAALHLSVPTVKAHVSRLLDKLDVDNRVQIALLVQDAGEH